MTVAHAGEGHVCTTKIMSPWLGLPDDFSCFLVDLDCHLSNTPQIWDQLLLWLENITFSSLHRMQKWDKLRRVPGPSNSTQSVPLPPALSAGGGAGTRPRGAPSLA